MARLSFRYIAVRSDVAPVSADELLARLGQDVADVDGST